MLFAIQRNVCTNVHTYNVYMAPVEHLDITSMLSKFKFEFTINLMLVS